MTLEALAQVSPRRERYGSLPAPALLHLLYAGESLFQCFWEQRRTFFVRPGSQVRCDTSIAPLARDEVLLRELTPERRPSGRWILFSVVDGDSIGEAMIMGVRELQRGEHLQELAGVCGE